MLELRSFRRRLLSGEACRTLARSCATAGALPRVWCFQVEEPFQPWADREVRTRTTRSGVCEVSAVCVWQELDLLSRLPCCRRIALVAATIQASPVAVRWTRAQASVATTGRAGRVPNASVSVDPGAGLGQIEASVLPRSPSLVTGARERATAAVRARLRQADVEPYVRMEASVVASVATLTGSARTQSALDAVVREVGKIEGVRTVEARVKVEPNP